MLKSSLVALFVSSLSLAACGGSDGGGSGVDGSKDLASLSDAEIINICEYTNSLISEATFIEISCYADAISGAQDGGNCQMDFDACVAASTPDPQDCSTAADDPLPACASMVTVSEAESCFNAQANAINGYNLSCSTTPEELNTLFDAPLPAACDAAVAKCPELFGQGQ